MSYREGAEKFYDFFGEKDDAPFYIEFALRHCGKALELGVGTARLAIKLARSGVETWGIDNSPYMLRAAKASLEKEPLEVQNRINLRLADVREFDLEDSFGLVYFPSFSFDHLLKRHDQVKALENVRRHMASGGVYIFDLAYVKEIKEESGWYVQRKLIDEEKTVVRTGYYKTYPEKRIRTASLWYELYENGRMVERYFECGEVFIHTPDGIRELLKEAGFYIVAWYGGHSKEKFDKNSKMMVIVTQPV